jgi:hypothetical protein
MARKITLSATAQAAILQGAAVLSLLGCVLAIATIVVVDWTILGFRNDMLATNKTVPANFLAGETGMIGINLVGIWLMLRDRPKDRTTDHV